jgi:hypothetical protein
VKNWRGPLEMDVNVNYCQLSPVHAISVVSLDEQCNVPWMMDFVNVLSGWFLELRTMLKEECC